ncbi:unnamed protein product [Meganyctiphanes norvegica]|uniref:Uncharacterized protein n=1 Tax=Meganyctiphanes norvegica TaxID=48144 RepID=A0AAV2S9B1_MEGNR
MYKKTKGSLSSKLVNNQRGSVALLSNKHLASKQIKAFEHTGHIVKAEGLRTPSVSSVESDATNSEGLKSSSSFSSIDSDSTFVVGLKSSSSVSSINSDSTFVVGLKSSSSISSIDSDSTFVVGLKSSSSVSSINSDATIVGDLKSSSSVSSIDSDSTISGSDHVTLRRHISTNLNKDDGNISSSNVGTEKSSRGDIYKSRHDNAESAVGKTEVSSFSNEVFNMISGKNCTQNSAENHILDTLNNTSSTLKDTSLSEVKVTEETNAIKSLDNSSNDQDRKSRSMNPNSSSRTSQVSPVRLRKNSIQERRGRPMPLTVPVPGESLESKENIVPNRGRKRSSIDFDNFTAESTDEQNEVSLQTSIIIHQKRHSLGILHNLPSPKGSPCRFSERRGSGPIKPKSPAMKNLQRIFSFSSRSPSPSPSVNNESPHHSPKPSSRKRRSLNLSFKSKNAPNSPQKSPTDKEYNENYTPPASPSKLVDNSLSYMDQTSLINASIKSSSRLGAVAKPVNASHFGSSSSAPGTPTHHVGKSDFYMSCERTNKKSESSSKTQTTDGTNENLSGSVLQYCPSFKKETLRLHSSAPGTPTHHVGKSDFYISLEKTNKESESSSKTQKIDGTVERLSGSGLRYRPSFKDETFKRISSVPNVPLRSPSKGSTDMRSHQKIR